VIYLPKPQVLVLIPQHFVGNIVKDRPILVFNMGHNVFVVLHIIIMEQHPTVM